MAQKRILIIDDDVDFVDLNRAVLENNGFEVETAFSAREGMDKVQFEVPDLILLDVLMPGEDGTLCVFQNKYGDALMLVRELDARLEHLPAALQEEVRDGLGFDDLATLEQWLESAES